MKTLYLIPLLLALLAAPALAQPADDSTPPSDTAVPVPAADAPAGAAEEALPDVQEDPVGAVEELVAHIRAGEWRMVFSLALAFLMFALARVRGRIPWFAGDRGGSILVFLLALLGAVSASLATPAPLDWKLFVGALGVTWMAVGGVNWVKRLIWPQDA